MTKNEYVLCQRGMLLFVFGLALGFVLPAFPVKQAALGVHQAALESGTFLIAVGLLWPKFGWSARKSIVMARLLWISFYVLMVGLTFAALIARNAAAGGAPNRVGQLVALVLNAGSSILMLVVTVLLLFAFRGVPIKQE
jgi:hypothetical protein